MVDKPKQPDFSKLHSGHISSQEILAYVKDPEWQKLRLAMKGKSLQERYDMMEAYLYEHKNSWEAQVRVTNYINALSRGGMIPPAGYCGQGRRRG